MAAQWMEERGLVGDLLGYMVVRDEKGDTFTDWDGVIHSDRRDAEVEVLTAKRRESLYEWYLAEVRRAGDA